MVMGQLIEYRSKDARSLVNINKLLFGRLSSQRHRGRRYVYYQPGFLDNIQYVALTRARYFVKGKHDLPIERLEELTNLFKVSEIDLDPEDDFVTAKEYWTERAEIKGWKIRNLK